jgi:hypothetical protein
MLITLGSLEPFNVPPVDNHQAAMFTKNLNGKETFEFDGEIRPKSFMLYEVKYNLPRHSYAHAFLLSVNIDAFLNECNATRHNTMEPIMKKYVMGRISIEYGGDLTHTQLKAHPYQIK